jgi:hypothetical protein
MHGREYGTFDPLTLTRIPRILVAAILLASNGRVVTGRGSDRWGARRRGTRGGSSSLRTSHLSSLRTQK